MNFDTLTPREIRRWWRIITRRLPQPGFPDYGWDWPTLGLCYPQTYRVLRELDRALARKQEPRT